MGGGDLTLEKMRVNERLEAVETHMKTGEENRQTLMSGFTRLEGAVKSMEIKLYGEKGEQGLVQQIEAMIKIANGIKAVLSKIFVSICSAMVFASLPTIFKYLSQVLAKHAGG